MTVGFKEPLNYPFVVSHSISSAQIFDYLPSVLKFPFSSAEQDMSDVAVHRIVPFGSQDANYIISVAEVYFPEDVVNQLQNLVTDVASSFYSNSDPTANMLALLIDIRVPLTGLNTAVKLTPAPPSDNGSVGSSSSDAKALNSGVVAGIAVGASFGSLAYMSLMVLLFRRYKKKNIELMSTDLESRVESGSASSGSGPGSLGSSAPLRASRVSGSSGTPSSLNTARFQISEPVNAQNSLGWSN